MTSQELRQLFLDFFKTKGHAIIPSASLIPENDPTVLFTTAGMHPLVPYLMGEKHPEGTRLADCQKCVRTDDIDEVGDSTHHTFFEMLGNWSLGDYFKKETIEWSWEFLTDKKWLGLDKNCLAVSVFEGDADAPFDQEAFDIWRGLGVSEKRIAKLPKKNNWWGPAGVTGPCGPDSEIFYWVGDPKKVPDSFNDDHPSWVEIWNDVFMQFNKTADGKFEKLAKQNVDTGMGLERTLAVMNGLDDNYKTDLFENIIKKIEGLSGKKYDESPETKKAMRVIADHLKAATFIMGDDKGVAPSNKDQGYVVRKLIRRAVRYGKELGIKKELWTKDVTEVVIGDFKDVYSELEKNSTKIFKQFVEEEKKFTHALELALKVFDKYNFEIKVFKEDIERLKEKLNFIDRNTFAGNLSLLTKHDEWVAKEYLVYSHFQKLFDYKRKYIDLYKNSLMILDNQQPAKIKESEEISQFIKNETDNILNNFVLRGAKVFELYQTYALPIEITKELAQENGIKIDEEGFWGEFKKHQELSQTASAGMFKGGLADASDETKKLHTAAHLMLAALRKVLGEHVTQKGSNITPERLRFDVSHPEKITPEQIKEVERLVNEAILTDADMGFEEMTVDEAKKQGAAGAFESKYGEKVKVYTAQKNGIIYSKEICGGPHVTRTGELGLFKITKEEASSAGVRRIKAVLSPK